MNILELLFKLSMVSMIGIYAIFSNTVMYSLTRFTNGSAVMVDINRQILNKGFLGAFWLSTLGSFYFVFTGELLESIGGAIFFIGTFVVTLLKNVPMNNKLLSDSQGAEPEKFWRVYQQKWLFWNHVRSTCAIVAGTLLMA